MLAYLATAHFCCFKEAASPLALLRPILMDQHAYSAVWFAALVLLLWPVLHAFLAIFYITLAANWTALTTIMQIQRIRSVFNATHLVLCVIPWDVWAVFQEITCSKEPAWIFALGFIIPTIARWAVRFAKILVAVVLGRMCARHAFRDILFGINHALWIVHQHFTQTLISATPALLTAKTAYLRWRSLFAPHVPTVITFTRHLVWAPVQILLRSVESTALLLTAPP